MKLIGNHRTGGHGAGVLGVGGETLPVGMGWISGTGKAGEVAIVFLSSIISGGLNQGVYIQAEGGASVQFTLVNPAQISDLTGAGGLWSNTLAVPAGTITLAPVLFTALKLVLTANGSFYIGTR